MSRSKGAEPLARIPEEVVEEVRNATNIVDFVGQYVQLQKSGKNLFGLCPFHEERTPSFSVSESKQIFHCFSCGRGGNVFKFLMELENLSFQEAVLKVAAFSHVPLSDSVLSAANETANRPVDAKTSALIELHEAAGKLFHHVLVNTELGQPALAYLHERGLTDATIDAFNLGFAPQNRLLKRFFDERQVDYQTLRHSGLFIENQEGELRDRFVDRIMYPIRNEGGQTVAFSGRLLAKADDQPKYLNSPETDLFNKRKVLFNFDQARGAIRKVGDVILFEGFMDVMSATQAGVTNGVASMGTSLTEEQIYALSRVTQQLYVCYDGDVPGQKATDRALTNIREQSSLKLGVITMPEGLDPDEYRQKYGEEKLKAALLTARETPVAFSMRYLRSQYDVNTDAGRLDYIEAVLAILATMTSPVEQDVYLTQLANDYQLDKTSLKQQLAMVKPTVAPPKQQPARRQVEPPVVTQHRQIVPIDRVLRAERHLLYRMLHEHSVWLWVTGQPGFSFVHEDYQLIFMLAQGYFQTHQAYSPAQFVDFIQDDHLQNLVIELENMQVSDASSEDEISDYFHVISDDAPLESRLKDRKQALAEATRLGDFDRQKQLVVEIVKLQQQKQSNRQA